ncbi:MAG: hypothetical protein ACI3XC_01975, partial [Phascolarctobacterium sp.]
LEDSFGIAMTEKVKQEVDEMCNLSQGVYKAGKVAGQKDTALEMLKDGEKLAKIIKYSKLTETTVKELAKENGLEVVVS